MPDFLLSADPAWPCLPRKTIVYALPPDVDPLSVEISVTRADYAELDLPGLVRPGAPLRISVSTNLFWGRAANVVNGMDQDVYSKGADFPASPLAVVGYSEMRRWKMVRVVLNPALYNPAHHHLKALTHVEFTIRFRRKAAVQSASLAADTVLDDAALKMVVNADDARAWYRRTAVKAADMNPGAVCVVMTADAIYSASPTIYGLTAHKQNMGYTVHVVTETKVDGNALATGWNEVAGQSPDGKADRIRKWLQDNYIPMSIKYVLLVGNPNPDGGDLPMKRCYSSTLMNDYDYASDSYYADLSGDWDINRDGLFGTTADDALGGVDFVPEVYVGRIPVYLSVTGWPSALQMIVQKINNYETSTNIAWRKAALLPESWSDDDTDGGYLGEAVKNSICMPKGYSSYTMYQQGHAPGAPQYDSIFDSSEDLRGDSVVNRWKNNHYGAVLWWGHGWSQGASVYADGTLFSTPQCDQLNDNYPAAVFMASCTCGDPTDVDNLGYSMLKNGGIASIAAANVSWYQQGPWSTNSPKGANASMGYEFTRRIVQDEDTFGEAFHGMKVDAEAGWRFNQLTFNLYGDPSLSIVSQIADSDGDGMPDGWELNYGLNPNSSTDASQNIDGDGWTNLQEYEHGTNPRNTDTDFDGLQDTNDPNPVVSRYSQVTLWPAPSGSIEMSYYHGQRYYWWRTDSRSWYCQTDFGSEAVMKYDLSALPKHIRLENAVFVYKASESNTSDVKPTTKIVPLGAVEPVQYVNEEQVYTLIETNAGAQVPATNEFPITSTFGEFLLLNPALQSNLLSRLPANSWSLGFAWNGQCSARAIALSNLSLVVSFEAIASDYSSMTVAGTFNGWDPAANNMMLVTDYTWQVDLDLTNASSVLFKFTANGSWTTNWGENNQSDFDLPISGNGETSGGNISVSGTLSGRYRFIFNEHTRAYSVQYILPDDDSDGMPNAWETAHGLNPNDAADATQDLDHDGYTNLQEYQNGTDPLVWNAPHSNYAAMTVAGTFNGWNPAASNMSLIGDYTWRFDSVFNNAGSLQFKFTANGNWGDNWGDNNQSQYTPPMSGTGEGAGGNILINGTLNGAYRFTFNEQTLAYSVQAISTPDTDADGMSDDWEAAYSLNAKNAQDAWQDGDGDGLCNVDEFNNSGDPSQADTDGDGANDLAEVIAGTQLNNTKSVFRAAPVTTLADTTLYWPGMTGRIYAVYYKSNLTCVMWTLVPGCEAISCSSQGQMGVAMPNPTGSTRYYKVRVQK